MSDKEKKRHRNDLLNELKEFSDDDYGTDLFSDVLPSEIAATVDSKKKNKYEKSINDLNEWDGMLSSMKFKKNKKYLSDSYGDFEDLYKKKKKKKKKKKNKAELTDFAKEFEPEIALYTNLLKEQSRFTDSLQKEYDSMKSTKSSSRGVNKSMTDLMENITDARTLAMQLVEKNVNTKKLIAELSMKEKKELGVLNEESNMGDFASSLLNKMISERSTVLQNDSEFGGISDYSDDEIDDSLEFSLKDSGRSPEADQNIKEEKLNPTIYAVMDSKYRDIGKIDENWYFIKVDEDGNEIPNANIPNKDDFDRINISQNFVANKHGEKYSIMWLEFEDLS